MIQDTSLQAYAEIRERLGHRQFEVLRALGKLSLATNTEIARYLGWPINTVTPRVGELRSMGYVVENGKRPCGVTGRTALVWSLKKEEQLNLF